jgi:hypothetical protein
MSETAMLESLMEMVEKNAHEMAKDLKQQILEDPKSSCYQTLDDQDLYAEIFQLYSHLGNWLLKDSEKGEVPTHYSELGKRRFREGFPLHQIVQALITTKRHIWNNISERGIMGNAKKLDTVIDFITFLNRFFDMSVYYTALGYYGPLGEMLAKQKPETKH